MEWDNKTPIYEQLKEAISAEIIEGVIAEGDNIPSIRQVASLYRINPLTVSKAYQLLMDEQVVEKQRGLGLFVKKGAKNKLAAKQRKAFLTHEWPLILKKIERLGVDLNTLTQSPPKRPTQK